MYKDKKTNMRVVSTFIVRNLFFESEGEVYILSSFVARDFRFCFFVFGSSSPSWSIYFYLSFVSVKSFLHQHARTRQKSRAF